MAGHRDSRLPLRHDTTRVYMPGDGGSLNTQSIVWVSLRSTTAVATLSPVLESTSHTPSSGLSGEMPSQRPCMTASWGFQFQFHWNAFFTPSETSISMELKYMFHTKWNKYFNGIEICVSYQVTKTFQSYWNYNFVRIEIYISIPLKIISPSPLFMRILYIGVWPSIGSPSFAILQNYHPRRTHSYIMV